MKKILSFLLLMIMSLGILCSCSGAEGPVGPQGPQGEQGQPGKDGHSPEITIGENGNWYIDGIDTGVSAKGENGTTADYNGTEGLDFYPINDTECAVAVGTAMLLKEIIIPSKYKNYTVTTILGGIVSLIGNSVSFAFCENLEKITLPNTITKIYDRAFYGCINLKEINIPSDVLHIGNYVFTGCDKLQYNEDENGLYLGNNENPYLALAKVKKNDIEDFILKEETKFILDEAFKNCSLLRNIEIPDSVTIICDDAFRGCSSLESITIPSSITIIESGVFSNCHSLTTVIIPNSVTSINNEAFYECNSLEGIVIPNSVTSIGSSAFSYCRSLTSIKLPNSVTNIGEKAFANCDKLTTIVIPSSVTTIGNSVFYCSYGASIYCEVPSKLDGWNSSWNYYNNPVYWLGQWEYDANGNPVPLS